MKLLLERLQGKRVLVTGHTGFKGSWLCRILLLCGAQVTGYALPPSEAPNLFSLLGLEGQIDNAYGDIRDLSALKKVYDRAKPEYVFHLAAQPIVRESYKNPVYTYETNVMGTVNLLECIRLAEVKPQSVIIVTTDKVYENKEWVWGYREDDRLGGFDPYSNSKSCAELVTDSYRKCFLSDLPISAVRSGNVIGGGDFAKDRIIPDMIRALEHDQPFVLRSPHAVRPFQHVLETLSVYLLIAIRQKEDSSLAGCYNIAPAHEDSLDTQTLTNLFAQQFAERFHWRIEPDNGPHEAKLLCLDTSKLRSVFGWSPIWNARTAVAKTAEWVRCYLEKEDLIGCVDGQIKTFIEQSAEQTT